MATLSDRGRLTAPALTTPAIAQRPARRHVLLTLTILALPFSYVPLELLPGKVSVTLVVFALVVATGIRYGVLRRRLVPLEGVTLALSAFILVRLTAVAALEGAAIDWADALGSALAPLGGVVLFRIAQRPDSKDACLRALRWMLLLLAIVALYQEAAGLAWLQGRGYAEGFYYFTFEGTYRPFGTFLSPTVFGAFLAVAGSALVCMSPTVRDALVSLAIVAVPLALTQTRAAWIAFALALAVGWLLRSRARPVHLTLGIAAAVWSAAFVVWLVPSAVDALVERLATITDAGFSSNLARVRLWEGTIEATLDGSPLVGYPADRFTSLVGAMAGEYADFGHAHSNYLQLLFLYGVIGLALFAAILVFALIGALRDVTLAASTGAPWAYGAVAALVAFTVDSAFETSWTSFSIVAALYFALGLGSTAVGGIADADAADAMPSTRGWVR
ncbi:O-antigen ligase family protein [Agrococcus sp. TSP3-2-1]|uniref:O-antigen ligase family protein n=1 Tax=Agrococcus sp. TSP3-2-1 TaxID=2804583 RepID=UPI003CF84455